MKCLNRILAPALLAGTVAAHAAGLYVCRGGAAPEYRDDAGAADCRASTPPPLGVISADRPAPAAVAPRPHARDQDHEQAALRARLTAERRRLDVLAREYQDGSPERRGDERNYAKYQERRAALAAELDAARRRIDALERQLER